MLEEASDLGKQRESSHETKERIINVARVLFAEYGINGINIRQIAAEAGINHSLIIRYFESKEKLAKEILQREIAKYVDKIELTLGQNHLNNINSMREFIKAQLFNPETQNIFKIIVRAELDGYAPELMFEQNSNRIAKNLVNQIESNRKDGQKQDARLTVIVVMASMVSLITLTPWLLSSIGMQGKDFDQSMKEELADILLGIITNSAGLPDKQTGFNELSSDNEK